jgi:hypothetical protein
MTRPLAYPILTLGRRLPLELARRLAAPREVELSVLAGRLSGERRSSRNLIHVDFSFFGRASTARIALSLRALNSSRTLRPATPQARRPQPFAGWVPDIARGAGATPLPAPRFSRASLAAASCRPCFSDYERIDPYEERNAGQCLAAGGVPDRDR